MEQIRRAPSKLALIRESGERSGRACEAMLSVMNGKLQSLIDHVMQLEDRVEQFEMSGRQGTSNEPREVISAGSVTIDHAARRVFVDSREVPLSPTEYRLIHQLALNSGRVVLHRDLMKRASVHGDVNQSNLKVYIGRLRAKLNGAAGSNCDLRAVRGVGYRLSA